MKKTEQDGMICDVKLLLEQAIITLDELDKAYHEVLAQLGKGRYPRITPKRLTERYQSIWQLLRWPRTHLAHS